jgi:filamentous hemagglutinin
MEVARTEGEIRAITAGKAELAKENIPEPAAVDTRDAWDAYNEKLQNSSAYRDTQAEWGTGSDIQRGIQAATAAVQGLLAGNVQGAAAGAAAPYLAELIHKETTSVNGNTQEVNKPANLIAHAVLGAVVAQLQGKNALAGAAGATTGEFIAQQLYPGVEHGKLSEEQKQKISALSTLAAGLAGSLASGDMSGTVAGASAGKNAAENNNLAVPAPSPISVPGVPVGPGDKVVKDANGKIASGLDSMLNGIGDALDKATECSFGRACSSDSDSGKEKNPNLGKDLTDDQKNEIGGTGSGTPGGHEPEDEESGRNTDNPLDPKNRAQHEEYVDSLRASMEKPDIKDENLKNLINDLYRPNAKVGSGSTADAVRYELATGERLEGEAILKKLKHILKHFRIG